MIRRMMLLGSASLLLADNAQVRGRGRRGDWWDTPAPSVPRMHGEALGDGECSLREWRMFPRVKDRDLKDGPDP